jgi:hypothetical protein
LPDRFILSAIAIPMDVPAAAPNGTEIPNIMMKKNKP